MGLSTAKSPIIFTAVIRAKLSRCLIHPDLNDVGGCQRIAGSDGGMTLRDRKATKKSIEAVIKITGLIGIPAGLGPVGFGGTDHGLALRQSQGSTDLLFSLPPSCPDGSLSRKHHPV